jgi:hypothetical protein
METLTLIVMGGLAGVMAGLLGIGGGALIVPVLVMVFESQHVNPDVIMQAALGTSMATIVFTAVSSVLAHQRRGAVHWPIFRQITPGIVIGSFAGTAIVHVLASRTLRIMFVVFMFLLAIQMARGTMATAAHRRRFPGAPVTGAVGVVIGMLSAFFGIGGGSMSVPFMTWNGIPARQAIATSAAIGFPIALSAAIGYIIAGWNVPGLPPWSLGYVALPAFAGIVVASTAAAPFGARLAHRLSETTLRRIFALFVAILGTRMLWTIL